MLNLDKIEKTELIDCSVLFFQDNKERLDKFLFVQFPEYSRSYFQQLINNGLIQINNKFIDKSSYKIKKTDIIKINFPEEKQFDLTPKKIDFEIIDIQNDFIVINKPAGLIVHHSERTSSEEITLVNGLLYKFKELNQLKDNQRPGIVHRLDKGTSGLLIVARNIFGQIKLASMFKKREIKKHYLAIVKGQPPKKGKIDFSIGRHPCKGHMMSHTSPMGKKALTYFEVLKYYKDCSLILVHIVTGRTHQIRVHLAAIGHGLIGDDLYGYQSKLISRPALHAWKLAFDYKGKKFNHSKHVPQDFRNLLFKLNNNN
ncbi:RluA family pseudouridine synthase [Candidatus Dependentiae bacterium]|nr:RluA family pseudouridine synthase [Candidatus Dependentiae bacterium]